MTPSTPQSLTPLRSVPESSGFRKGDVLVLVGELFARGYANGIVDEATRHGLTIVCSTVGRRSPGGGLRALNADEIAAMKLAPTSPLINVPLEAGFDLEPCAEDGTTPVDQLKGVKMSDWESVKLDWKKVESSRQRANERFRKNLTTHLAELEKTLAGSAANPVAKGANVIFAHLMAGGVPRAKILMPTMNWVFKGTGERHLASERFWKSDLGKFCDLNFTEVTSETFRILLELSTPLRERIEKAGGRVSYVAYGYHGTEVLIRGEYAWQSYAPYVQGWAKMRLEDTSKEWTKKGVRSCVFNCPEILTNSSSIFAGVEIPLYPFMAAMKKTSPDSERTLDVLKRCQGLLKPEHTIDEMLKFADGALTSDELRSVCHFDKWPEHNNQKQMDLLIQSAGHLIDMHQDPKNLITFILSEEIFRATGYLMFHEAWEPSNPVLWLGHDVLAKALASAKTL